MASLAEIVRYTDRFLRIAEIGDWDNALNGLQVENSGRVTKIGAAVDASTRALSEAAREDVDVLIVHHGLFWSGLRPVRGIWRRQLQIAFENDIALYSAHLPLDLHPQVGNNAQLARALRLKSTTRFFE
ncbi:MAG TPA: Nif3-like dinuclear metal center hexameric protein, partial [Chthoniobacterales bacterium]